MLARDAQRLVATLRVRREDVLDLQRGRTVSFSAV